MSGALIRRGARASRTEAPLIREHAIKSLLAPERQRPPKPHPGFHLFRYFTVTGLVAFATVAVALYILEKQEGEYFLQVQNQQRLFVTRLQKDFARDYEENARGELLVVHEAGHVSLTRLLANALWASHFATFVSKAETVPVEHCRSAAPESRTACWREVRQRIQAIPEFRPLDAKLASTARGSAVFKIKVFDLRGITVYSSEHEQIGEDKRNNRGWQLAAEGKAASELTRRDTFSAFEGVVENRDLISTYVPAFMPGERDRVTGVFEIYSDVTPLFERIKLGSARIEQQAHLSQERFARAATDYQKEVESNAYKLLGIVLGLLAMLYGVLLLIVHRAQRILDAQERAREEWIARESRWHREKMTALATMAASMAHEIGNPLAVISGIMEEVSRNEEASKQFDTGLIIEQVRRVAGKTREMAEFAARHSEAPEPVDLNETVKGICEFLSFDRRFRRTRIEFRPAAQLPTPVVVSDHLSEAVMNLLQIYVEDEAGSDQAPKRIIVDTAARDREVVIRMTCEPPPQRAASESRIEMLARRVAGMSGNFRSIDGVSEIVLPVPKPVPS